MGKKGGGGSCVISIYPLRSSSQWRVDSSNCQTQGALRRMRQSHAIFTESRAKPTGPGCILRKEEAFGILDAYLGDFYLLSLPNHPSCSGFSSFPFSSRIPPQSGITGPSGPQILLCGRCSRIITVITTTVASPCISYLHAGLHHITYRRFAKGRRASQANPRGKLARCVGARGRKEGPSNMYVCMLHGFFYLQSVFMGLETKRKYGGQILQEKHILRSVQCCTGGPKGTRPPCNAS